MSDSSVTWDDAVSVDIPGETPFWSTSIPWDEPCEALFEYLASRDPVRLLGYLEADRLPKHLLTFAAEWAGRVDPRASLRECCCLRAEREG